MKSGQSKGQSRWRRCLVFLAAAWVIGSLPALAGDLDEIQRQGVLRHLGVPYAKFITGSGDGLDVEMVQAFARHLGVAYRFVPTTWESAFGDLTGRDVKSGKPCPVRGDILASGVTILEWRKKLALFSVPTFPSQVWLIARADHPLSPIVPGPDLDAEIARVKALLRERTVLGMAQSCLDPLLYGLSAAGAKVLYFEGRLNELAPAVINKVAGLALLDVPDALVALEKWPGQIKVIGPVSGHQQMGAAVDRGAVRLVAAFNRFFEGFRQEGEYQSLVEKYYPFILEHDPDFFGGSTPLTSKGQGS